MRLKLHCNYRFFSDSIWNDLRLRSVFLSYFCFSFICSDVHRFFILFCCSSLCSKQAGTHWQHMSEVNQFDGSIVPTVDIDASLCINDAIDTHSFIHPFTHSLSHSLAKRLSCVWIMNDTLNSLDSTLFHWPFDVLLFSRFSHIPFYCWLCKCVCVHFFTWMRLFVCLLVCVFLPLFRTRTYIFTLIQKFYFDLVRFSFR